MKQATQSFGKKWLGLLLLLCPITNAFALELDWSGQFWAEYNFVHGYSMDGTNAGSNFDPARSAGGGYYTPTSGSQDANFQSLFLRLRPKVIVNDNIYIKSEFWLGDPLFGLFGSALPYSVDQRQYYSNQSRGSIISAQRLWGEFVSDFGTFQVGRVPLQWGLGLVWNGGENLWDRYMSTGDAVRWVAKFGSFSLIPSFIMSSAGNSVGGSCTLVGGVCNPGISSGSVTDYSLILKYENPEDELEVGANIVKRLGGSNQDPNGGILTPPQTAPGIGPYATAVTPGVSGQMNYITYDLYARKKLNRFTLGAEIPISSGMLSGTTYQTFAVAAEVNYKASDVTEFNLKLGHAPGQKSVTNPSLDAFRSFYFNPNYHIAMIMFNYQLANFAGAQTQNNPGLSSSQLASPYDNPIVNATYFALSVPIKPWEKWTFRPNIAYAFSPEVAAAGQYFYNYRTKTLVRNTTGRDQGNGLGWEFDLGITFQWDEYFQVSFDNGIYLPGSFYAFSNTAADNALTPVFASSLRVGVNF